MTSENFVILYCKFKRPNIFSSNESLHRQTNKIKILTAAVISTGKY